MNDGGRKEHEIEIIPPGVGDEGFASSRVWIGGASGRVKVIKLGPLQSLFLGLGLVGLCLLMVFFFSGIFLVAAPIVALAGAGAWVASKLGVGPFKRLK